MRFLVAALFLAAVAVTAPLTTQRETNACSIGVPLLPQAMDYADLVAIGTLSNTDRDVAVFNVETFYRDDGQSNLGVSVDNRTFNTTPSCDRMYTNDSRYQPGRYLALLERTGFDSPADYEVTWAGLALYPVVDGEVQITEYRNNNFEQVEYTVEELEAEFGLQPSTPDAATAPPTAASTPVPPEAAGADGDGDSGASPFLWAVGGLVLGAAGVGAVWWTRSRRASHQA